MFTSLACRFCPSAPSTGKGLLLLLLFLPVGDGVWSGCTPASLKWRIDLPLYVNLPLGLLEGLQPVQLIQQFKKCNLKQTPVEIGDKLNS